MSKRTNARTPYAPTMRIYASSLSVRAEADGIPAGCCGVVTGIAIVYNVVDSHNTRFLPGSLDKTRNKVAAGKVKLFDNHGAIDGYGTRTHVGTVRELKTVGAQELMTAEILDSEDGRRCHEYLKACMLSKAETGLSIGFYEREYDWNDLAKCVDFSEVELEEISLAPRQAVPGADVLTVRTKPGGTTVEVARGLMLGLRRTMDQESFTALLDEFTEDPADDAGATTSEAEGQPTPADDATRTHANEPGLATMEQRMHAFRQSFALNNS